MKNSYDKSVLEGAVNSYTEVFNKPGYDFDIVLARIFICAFLIWKLLSRDFGAFAYIPTDVFYFYPYQIYSIDKWILWTGVPVLQDILTLHFIHWIVPYPNASALQLIQFFAILFLIILGMYGKGKKSVIIILAYATLIYLWGYLILLGQEIDSIDLYFGMLIVLCIGEFNDAPAWRLKGLLHAQSNLNAGRTQSLLILVIVFYYFASGAKKITDLSPVEWFNYNLIESIMYHGIVSDHSALYRPQFFELFDGLYFLNYILPPLV